jgi:peptidoglycan/LPS O-acetylase OafA/YrhL
MQQARISKRPDSSAAQNHALNVIRSASALMVVLGHVRILFFQDYANVPHNFVTAILYAFTSLGSEAVIVFFVLSGYWVGGGVISRIRGNNFSWGSYASSRLTRLWLVLLPALVLTLIVDQIGRAAFSGSDIYAQTAMYDGVVDEPSYSPLVFLGNLLFMQDIHVVTYGLNHPLWSLAYEFWYYLLFPALLIAFRRGGSAHGRVVAIALLLAGSFIAGAEVLVLFPAWMAGALVAYQKARIVTWLGTVRQGTLAAARSATFLATLGAMVVAHEVHLPGVIGHWLVAAVAALFVLLLIRDVEWSGIAGRSLRSVSQTAHSSYSLYAIHMPVIALLCAVMVPSFADRWFMDGFHVIVGLVIVAGLYLLSFAFAAVTEARTDQVRAALQRSFRRAVTFTRT